MWPCSTAWATTSPDAVARALDTTANAVYLIIQRAKRQLAAAWSSPASTAARWRFSFDPTPLRFRDRNHGPPASLSVRRHNETRSWPPKFNPSCRRCSRTRPCPRLIVRRARSSWRPLWTPSWPSKRRPVPLPRRGRAHRPVPGLPAGLSGVESAADAGAQAGELAAPPVAPAFDFGYLPRRPGAPIAQPAARPWRLDDLGRLVIQFTADCWPACRASPAASHAQERTPAGLRYELTDELAICTCASTPSRSGATPAVDGRGGCGHPQPRRLAPPGRQHRHPAPRRCPARPAGDRPLWQGVFEDVPAEDLPLRSDGSRSGVSQRRLEAAPRRNQCSQVNLRIPAPPSNWPAIRHRLARTAPSRRDRRRAALAHPPGQLAAQQVQRLLAAE